MYHASLNVSLMVSNVTQIKSGATINVSVSVKVRKNISIYLIRHWLKQKYLLPHVTNNKLKEILF